MAKCSGCRSTSTRLAAFRSHNWSRVRDASSASGASTFSLSTICNCSRGRRTRNENRVQEITEITTGLKALAKELERTHSRALPAVSRQVESRDDKRPQLIRPARVGFDRTGRRHRDVCLSRGILPQEPANRGKAPPEFITTWQNEMERAHGRAEIIIGKQRHGPTGTVELAFEDEVTRFSNLAVRRSACPRGSEADACCEQDLARDSGRTDRAVCTCPHPKERHSASRRTSTQSVRCSFFKTALCASSARGWWRTSHLGSDGENSRKPHPVLE